MGRVRTIFLPVFILFLLGSCSGVVTDTGGGGELTPESEGGSGTEDGASGSGTGVEPGGEAVSGGGAAEYTGSADGGGAGGASGGGNSLYETGPIDLPVPIAKLESIDPRYVIVNLSGNSLTLRGEAGAVTNVSASPQVWCQDSLTAEIKTTSTNSDGSFATITFTYASNEPSTSVTVAGYDGTSIGTPVFLKISNNLYVWILTNGSSISRGSLAMDGDSVYMVLHMGADGLPAPSMSRSDGRGTATSSHLYALDVGGIPEILATGDIILEQLFVTEGEVLTRSGNDFYIPDGTSFKKLFSIGSAETILQVDAEADHSGKQWIAVATDRAAYVCDRTGSCSEIADFDNLSAPAIFQGMIAVSWSKYLIGTDPVFFLQLVWEEKSGTSLTTSSWSYRPGETIESDEDQWGWNWFEIDNVDLTGTSAGTYIHKGLLKQGTIDSNANRYRPATWVNKCSDTLSNGNVKELETTMIETSWNIFYLLDAEVTVNTKTSVVNGNITTILDSICYAKPTRVVYNAEIHPNEDLIFFCAEDENGKGQMYCLCENKIEEDTSDGWVGTGKTGYKGISDDSIVQLTEGEEHCTKEKNWKIDRHVASNGDITGNAVVIVNAADPTRPQIQFIDPYNDPLLEDCIE